MGNTFPPAFTIAMRRYVSISERLGDDHIEARNAFVDAMDLAPKWFADEAHAMAKQMGLIPDPTGYLDNGDPVYSLESIAKAHGITIEEADQAVQEMRLHRRI